MRVLETGPPPRDLLAGKGFTGKAFAAPQAAEPPPVPGPAEPPTQPEDAAGHTIDRPGLAGDVATGEVIAALA